MRIRDWSSDVCSSDLLQGAVDQRHRHGLALAVSEGQPVAARELGRLVRVAGELADHLAFGQLDFAHGHCKAQFFDKHFHFERAVADLGGKRVRIAIAALRGIAHRQQKTRSEEHTSELQSLMRISYAVFCLKKKKKQYNKQQHKSYIN